MHVLDLPLELLEQIITLAISDHPKPPAILCTNSTFYDLGLRVLHTALVFKAPAQLAMFNTSSTPLSCMPKTVELSLGGGTSDFNTFDYLHAAFLRCLKGRDLPFSNHAGVCFTPRIELDGVYLCFHSHARNKRLHVIRKALGIINPTKFEWTGPDPAHHFSTAIVPEASYHLLQTIPSWTHLQHLVLTNISLGEPISTSSVFADYTPPECIEPLLPAPVPSLRTIYIGQATFLPPISVAAFLNMDGMDELESVRLVDCYEGSIWGRRVRRGDVECAGQRVLLAASRDRDEDMENARDSGCFVYDGYDELRGKWLGTRIQNIVICEAKTERFMGGDRASEGGSTLI